MITFAEEDVMPRVHFPPFSDWQHTSEREEVGTSRSVIVSNGWLAGLILRGTGYGIIGDIIVGLIGAFIGNWLVHAFHFSVNLGSPVADRIVVSVVGAVLLILIIGLLRPRSLRERFTNVWRR
jgi:uncharacterized membrane protein YeaQ/YmgE (transglycosylase-associated protein family)